MEKMNYYYSDIVGEVCSYMEVINKAKENYGITTQDDLDEYMRLKKWYGVSVLAAKEFYRDLCGVINGSSETTRENMLSEEFIAKALCIPLYKAKAFLYTCAVYGITDKQGDKWVI